MDSFTEHRLFDSGTGESIPRTVYDEPVDPAVLVVKQLKAISTDIEQIKENQVAFEDLHNQLNDLTHAISHVVRQNTCLVETTKNLQKSLREVKRDLQTVTHKKKIEHTTHEKGTEKTKNRWTRKGIPRRDWKHMIHIEEALQENFQHFVDNLSFSSTSIPDKLLESECLSDDECSMIRAKHEKDQVRFLIYKLMTRGPERIFAFLEILKENKYDSLTRNVYRSLERLTAENTGHAVNCIVCLLKRNVDLRDISDYLFGAKLINREMYGAILDNPTLYENRESIWAKILHNVNEAEQFENSKKDLIEAVSAKYDYLGQHLKSHTMFLQCHCGTKRRRLRTGLCRDLGSQTDISTTSDAPQLKHLRSTDSTSEPDSTSVVSSLEPGTSFADLTVYQPQNSGHCDSTTDSKEPNLTNKDRSRHSSGRFEMKQSQVGTIHPYKTQESMPYVDIDVLTDRPIVNQSISRATSVTVREADSTTESGYITSKTNDTEPDSNNDTSVTQSPTTATPVEEKLNQLRHGQEDRTNDEMDGDQVNESQSAHVDRPDNVNIAGKGNSSPEQVDQSASTCSEDERALKLETKTRVRRKKSESKRKTYVLTKSKVVTAQTKHLERPFHMKKQNIKRKERRDRKLESFAANEHSRPHALSTGPIQKGLPYNPTWGKQPQRPPPVFDYNQARRHWLMSHRMAKIDRQSDTYTDQSWTEGSETEYTV